MRLLKIASILDELHVSYRLLGDIPGLIAEIGTGNEIVAVRADIDALWQEVDGNGKQIIRVDMMRISQWFLVHYYY